jgi:hypothetical protein
MSKPMNSETDVRLGKAGSDTVVVYRMLPEVAELLADILLEYVPEDLAFEADARNLTRLARQAREANAA